ncbi:MAG TPA: thioredoxin [Vicinamibacterales bacterium]
MSAAEFDNRGIVVTCPSCAQKNRLAYDRLGEPVRCGKCHETLRPPAEPLDVSSAVEFDRLIAQASLPVVVDYWAPWCEPCRMVAPEVAKVATRRAGRAVVIKVNTDEVPELGERFGIRSIPTLAVFAGGREVSRVAGARPAEDIERLVDQAAVPSNR